MPEQLLLEYIFFHEKPRQQFKAFLHSRNIDIVKEAVDKTDVDGLTVFISDDLDDELSAEIESFYDDMMVMTEELIKVQNDTHEMNNAGLAVTLADGRSVLASVDVDVVNKVLSVVTHQQLGELVDSIVEAVENPDQRPLCKRVEV